MTRALIAIATIAACNSTPSPTTPTPPAPPADPHAAIVDNLVGVWTGNATGTPFGDFPMALAFDRLPTGAVHSRLQGQPGMYLDFTFDHDKLVEEGAIPNVGTQTHTLVAAKATHWSDDAVDVDIVVTGDALVWTTSVHGKQHSLFQMKRRTGEAATKVREAIAARAHSE